MTHQHGAGSTVLIRNCFSNHLQKEIIFIGNFHKAVDELQIFSTLSNAAKSSHITQRVKHNLEGCLLV